MDKEGATVDFLLRAKLELRGTIAVVPSAKATSLDILNSERATPVDVVTESCNPGNLQRKAAIHPVAGVEVDSYQKNSY